MKRLTFDGWMLVSDAVIIPLFTALVVVSGSLMFAVLLGMMLMRSAGDYGRWSRGRRR